MTIKKIGYNYQKKGYIKQSPIFNATRVFTQTFFDLKSFSDITIFFLVIFQLYGPSEILSCFDIER